MLSLGPYCHHAGWQSMMTAKQSVQYLILLGVGGKTLLMEPSCRILELGLVFVLSTSSRGTFSGESGEEIMRKGVKQGQRIA